MRTKEVVESEMDSIIGYMQKKIISRDWHAVSDAANDLRELETEKALIVEIESYRPVVMGDF